MYRIRTIRMILFVPSAQKGMVTVMAKTFEEAVKELEKIVTELESGDISLDESITLFEKGMKLSKSLEKMLDSAEKKVTQLLTDENGELKEEPFPDMN